MQESMRLFMFSQVVTAPISSPVTRQTFPRVNALARSAEAPFSIRREVAIAMGHETRTAR
jgi:hypothetical protein